MNTGAAPLPLPSNTPPMMALPGGPIPLNPNATAMPGIAPGNAPPMPGIAPGATAPSAPMPGTAPGAHPMPGVTPMPNAQVPMPGVAPGAAAPLPDGFQPLTITLPGARR